MIPWTAYDGKGQRKYLTHDEREAFLRAATLRERDVYVFCWLLAVTGCRISEALALSSGSLDFKSGHVIVECLKKRGKKVFRAIPLPPSLLDILEKMLGAGELPHDRLWPWSRMTGFRRVREVMQAARIQGPHASPKGLRHAFGVCAIQANVPLNLVQRWLGHADIKTTAIYTDAMGPEEREFASRFWLSDGGRSPGSRPRKSPKPHFACASRPGGRGTRAPPERKLAGDRSRGSGCRSLALLRLSTLLNYRIVRALNSSALVRSDMKK